MRIKKGDRVRSTKDAAKTGTVEEDDGSSNPYRVRWDGGGQSGWLYPRDLQVEGRNLSGLMLASSKGLTGVVEGLLGAGAKAELVDEDGRSSLMLALQGGHAETAMKLIAATAAAGGLDLQDKQGRSGLMLASSKGLTGVVEGLLGAGAKAELVDEQTRMSSSDARHDKADMRRQQWS